MSYFGGSARESEQAHSCSIHWLSPPESRMARASRPGLSQELNAGLPREWQEPMCSIHCLLPARVHTGRKLESGAKGTTQAPALMWVSAIFSHSARHLPTKVMCQLRKWQQPAQGGVFTWPRLKDCMGRCVDQPQVMLSSRGSGVQSSSSPAHGSPVLEQRGCEHGPEGNLFILMSETFFARQKDNCKKTLGLSDVSWQGACCLAKPPGLLYG